MQPETNATDQELLMLAAATEQLAMHIVDRQVADRLNAIAREVRAMAGVIPGRRQNKPFRLLA